jgi:hypothetical protein
MGSGSESDYQAQQPDNTTVTSTGPKVYCKYLLYHILFKNKSANINKQHGNYTSVTVVPNQTLVR